MNNIWICAIAKMEELYIREWILYHKNLGIDHIIIGDNNDSDYKIPLKPLIQDFIDEGYVEYIDKRDVLNAQLPFYNEIYSSRKGFDWIGFIDIDEFLVFPKNFFEDKSEFDSVIFGWEYYGDNNNVYYENKPVLERFTECFRLKSAGIKFFIKPIKGFLLESIHNPGTNIKVCDVLKEKPEFIKKPNSSHSTRIVRKENYHNIAYIKHFVTKSTEEYIKYKMLRGRCDRKIGNYEIRYNKNYYYGINIKTEEKEELFEKYSNQIIESENNQLWKYRLNTMVK